MSSDLRICCLAERQVGIGSAAAAIEPHFRANPSVTWVDVTYVKSGGWIERLPLPGRSGGVLRGLQQATSALLRAKFDALFFLTHNPAVFQQWALSRTPTLLWTDVTPALLDAQAEAYEHPVDSSRALQRLKHRLVRRTFERASWCAAWSEWARRSFACDYAIEPSRTKVVAPGIDLTKFKLERAPREGLPRLLFVGGNFARKGGDLLLDVFRKHLRGRCELDIVTRDEVAAEPGVRVHRGLRAGTPELLELYDRASVFVLPTRGDCYSIASLEAMAKGLPVVVSAVGGISDIVEHGESGYLLDAVRGDLLLQSLEALLADSKRAADMGRRGRRIAEERFDARETASRLLAMLTELAAAKRRHLRKRDVRYREVDA